THLRFPLWFRSPDVSVRRLRGGGPERKVGAGARAAGAEGAESERGASGAGEVGVAPLHEAGHALLQVGGGGGERLIGALEVERPAEVGFEALVEEPLRQPQRPRGAGSEPGRE